MMRYVFVISIYSKPVRAVAQQVQIISSNTQGHRRLRSLLLIHGIEQFRKANITTFTSKTTGIVQPHQYYWVYSTEY